MNKVLAEIIAGVIPCKMERNRWRGILRYGVWNALKLRYRMKHDHTSPKYYLSVCAIAKNEGPYFEEFEITVIGIDKDLSLSAIDESGNRLRFSSGEAIIKPKIFFISPLTLSML